MYAPGRRWRPQEKPTNPSNNHLTIKKEYFIMKKITSFTINHLKLLPGVYVSRVDYVAGNPVTTFDLRMTAPNREPVMNTAEMAVNDAEGFATLAELAKSKVA